MKKQNITVSKSDFIEFVKSNIAGNAMFVTTYITYFICNELLGIGVELALLYAMIVGNTFGNLLNFMIQKMWVFKPSGKKSATTIQAGRYTLFVIMNAAINYGLIIGLDKFFGISPYIGQFVAGLFFFVWNYLWYKLWIFKKATTNGSAKTKQKTT